MSKRKIVDAKNDSKGNIVSVRLQGNQSFTPLKRAIQMTKRGEIDAVVVRPKDGTKVHLRTRPDNKTKNNLDEMADD